MILLMFIRFIKCFYLHKVGFQNACEEVVIQYDAAHRFQLR